MILLHSLLLVCISGVARSLALAGHLLYASPLVSRSRKIVCHEWDEHGALAGHLLGQAQPLLCHWYVYTCLYIHP